MENNSVHLCGLVGCDADGAYDAGYIIVLCATLKSRVVVVMMKLHDWSAAAAAVWSGRPCLGLFLELAGAVDGLALYGLVTPGVCVVMWLVLSGRLAAVHNT